MSWSLLQLITGAVIFVYIPALPGLCLQLFTSAVLLKTSLSELVLNKCLFSHFLPGLGFVVIGHVLHCVSGVPQSRHPVTVPTLFWLFGVSSLPPKTVSFCVGYCLRLQERILVSDIEDYHHSYRLVGWVPFSPGARVSCYFPLPGRL